MEVKTFAIQSASDGRNRAELFANIVDDAFVGCSSCAKYRPPHRELIQNPAKAAVVGAKVVSPVTDAVGLIDDEQPPLTISGSKSLSLKSLLLKRSGDMSSTSTALALRAISTCVHSSLLLALIVIAISPRRDAAAIWSRISANKGETMTVVPAPSSRRSFVATK